MRIGVVGYSKQSFDRERAIAALNDAFNRLPTGQHSLVSGLTNLGVPGLAYQEADKRGWYLIGIACRKATNYDLYPVHKEVIQGDNWGDESELFLNSIDCLICVGGGNQSLAETQQAKYNGIPVIEYEL